jgi:hypothetical protein
VPQRKRHILVFIAILILGFGSGFLLANEPAPVPIMNADTTAIGSWPMMRRDSDHTAYNPDTGSFRPPLALLDTISFRIGEQTFVYLPAILKQ